MTSYNAGVEAAIAVMDDLDHSGWFAAAIRARALRDEPTISDHERGVRAALLAYHQTDVDQRDDEGVDEFYQRAATEKVRAMNALIDR